MSETAAVILAAGKGTRMRSDLPKVLHPLAGQPMIGHVLAALGPLELGRTVVVVGPDMDDVAAAVAPHPTVVQPGQNGTGDAVKAARAALAGADGTVLIVFGDTPLLRSDTLVAMRAAREARPERAVVVLGFRAAEPGGYGRLLLGPDGALTGIVEARDATPQQLEIELCNSGVMAVDGARLFDLLDRIGNDNAKGEYYLTDIVAVAREQGLDCGYIEAAEAELIGVNSRAELARAEAVLQQRLRAAAMEAGATLIDPDSVWLSHDTVLGQDVTVQPNVVFGPGVRVGAAAEIRAFSHIEGAEIAAGAVIGPFARLRPGARIGAEARVGNFVEVKNATLEDGAKANHLSYVGDARVGAGANVGAGTITCNYDGFDKGHTDIGAGAFIGSNSALVAPVKVGDGAIVGAGSTISRDVEADALALTRAKQESHAGWAAEYRARKAATGKGKRKKSG
ncbi:MAG: bifunctional UDP-N-acetylglucosamine diphosphorylase/glucosamine-1-phosphate N-acetyltransferase GlmU [Alphaproteobacteria bacterium]|nr:bifunctional UDP-N-acetylglucosamine diphosphorylase/glucosamine-1-phosphate N-acetyltransferase GlmU [Alphaproteobacteria bacterium]